MTAWQSRALERLYPVVFFEALRVKIRDESVHVQLRTIIKTRGSFQPT